MSFKIVEKKFDSFFSAVAHFLKEVFGDQSVESKVNGTLTLLTPAVIALVNLAGGSSASALVNAGLSQFKADYATLCAVTQGSFPAPGGNAASTVKGLIESLKGNLSAILTDAGIKNSQHSASISSYATFFFNEAEAILTELEGQDALPVAKIPPVTQMPSPAGIATNATAAAPIPAVLPAVAAASAPAPAAPILGAETMAADDLAPEAEAPPATEAPVVLSAGVHQAQVKPLI